MDGENKKIVIVMHKYSVIVKGIERKLADCGYSVTVLAGQFDALKDLAAETSLFIAYLPNGVTEETMPLESGWNVLLIGEKKDRPVLLQNNPQWENFAWLDRPVKMDELERAVEAAIASAGKKTILVVDDDPSYAKMVREWLKDAYRVYTVTGGMNAITFLLATPVDIILLDYEMPVVDGPQVLQMLRQEPATKDIPVIFLTGVGAREDVERVMALKPDGYILKSTTKEKLLEYLREKV